MKKSILIYILFVIRMIFAVFVKKNYHIDEMYSYGLSNYQEGLLLEFEEFTTYEKGTSPYDWYMTVGEEERFDYEMVYENQVKDVHPPLYYIFLHTIASFFTDVYSKWFAAAINLFFAVVTLYFLRKIIRIFINDEKICNGISLFFAVSPGILNAAAFFRMYVMSMGFMTIFSWILLEHVKSERPKEGLYFYGKLFLTAVAGAMTHYYCIVYIILQSVVYAAYLLWKERGQGIWKFCGTMALSGAVSYLLFPQMLIHVLHGERGEQSMDNLYNLSDYGERIKCFFETISSQLFGGLFSVILWLLLIVGICLPILLKLSKKLSEKIHLDLFEYTGFMILIVPVTAYYLLISKIAVYVTDRYMYPVYGILFVAVLCPAISVIRKFVSEQKARIVSFVLFAILTMSGYAVFDGGYFYPESKPLLEEAQKYSDVDCVIVYGEAWTLPSLYPEVTNYQSVTFVSEKNFERLLQSDLWKEQMILTCVGVESGKPYFDGVANLQSRTYESEKIGSFGYGSSYLYIEKD